MILYKLSPYGFLKRKITYKLFKIMTKKSLKIFLRGADVISMSPQLEGIYEHALTKFIQHNAENGFGDFFIDIGANIGISSCQNGNSFKKVFCFEPNPLCINILKTNLSISLHDGVAEVFDFALGDEDGMFDLYIPKYNWGGAFVRNGNDYPEDVLGKKDGFGSIDEENYVINTVNVKNSVVILNNLFLSLIAKNLRNGVIKIDVEGFERKVLLAIAETLPPSLNVSIVFENWDPTFDINEITSSFTNRSVNYFKFHRSVAGSSKSKFSKYFKFLLFGEKTTLVNAKSEDNIIGDVVLKIE